MFLIFDNTREVIRAEKVLKAAQIKAIVKPLPRELSAECGMCLYVDSAREEVQAALEVHHIEYRVGV
ncbi:MAG: DUF3343 domain-containing protein [Bacteroidales bacterium]